MKAITNILNRIENKLNYTNNATITDHNNLYKRLDLTAIDGDDEPILFI